MSDQVGVEGGDLERENPPSGPEDPVSDAVGLARAYAETAYRVLTDPPFVLRIGETSPELCRLHRARGVVSSAFLSAANPGSRLLTHEKNEERARAFIHILEQRGLDFVPGIGGAEDQAWPPEPSVLVLGITLDVAQALGREVGQRAFVWNGVDAVPSLVWID